MAHQDTMIFATASHEPSPSGQSLSEIFSPYYLTTTNIHSSLLNLPRKSFQQYLEHSYQNRESTHHSETASTCPPQLPTDFQSGKNSRFQPLSDVEPSCRHFLYPNPTPCYFGGTLDSPLVLTHSFLDSETPLSPPLTLPASIMSLPINEGEIEDCFSPPLNRTLDLPDQEDISNSPPPLLDVFTPSSQSSLSTLNSPPSLSPIFPSLNEWFSYTLSPPRLPSSGLESLNEKLGDSLSSLFANPDCHCLNDGGSVMTGLTSLHDLPAPPLLNFHRLDGPNTRPIINDPLFSTTICSSPISHDQVGLDPIELEDKPYGPPGSGSPIVTQSPIEWPHETEQTANQLEDQYPGSTVFHPTYSPSVRNSSLPELDDLGDTDIDFPSSLVNLAPPPSPSRRGSFADLPDDDLDVPLTLSKTTQETFDDTLALSPPESPGLTLQSLPGADTDESLIPVELASPGRNSARLPILQPRLLIVEDGSVLHPSQRSLSPEPCDLLDANMMDLQIGGDDQLRRMYGVMKRTKEREGAAKSMESILEEEERTIRSLSRGNNRDVNEAWNKLMIARRKSKRLREKVRETATLLRLKLAEKGWKTEKDGFGKSILVPITPSLNIEDATGLDSHPSKGPTQKRLRITNPQQLLVKMLMDRQESQFSPSGRAASPSSGTVSPLGRTSISAADLDMDDGTIPDIVDILDVDLDMNLKVGGF